MKLSEENVPANCSLLFPLVKKWGIGDDYEREQKVATATDEELIELVMSLEDERVDSQRLFDWLEGEESYNLNPSTEYVAFTCFTMARDSAKTKLKQRGVHLYGHELR